ncbi:MAG: hypothetical protein J6Y02_13265 [Pseudobutyrivibrio sp.]|nr:hypothetical protein [Pseudobutyrivibrio sp.]
MFDKVKNIFAISKNKAKDVKDNTAVIPKAVVAATKEEIKEIKDLNLTEVDQLQGDIIASVAITAMASMGIPASATMREIIKTAAAYTIRDFKEGYTNPEKLIVTRVINKIHELRDAKAAEKDRQ